MHVCASKHVMKAALALFLMTTAAQAQAVCMPLDKVIVGLEGGKIQEQSSGAGISAGMLLRLFVNAKTGTWTFLQIRPDGIACILLAGDGWQWPDKKIPGKAL